MSQNLPFRFGCRNVENGVDYGLAGFGGGPTIADIRSVWCGTTKMEPAAVGSSSC